MREMVGTVHQVLEVFLIGAAFALLFHHHRFPQQNGGSGN